MANTTTMAIPTQLCLSESEPVVQPAMEQPSNAAELCDPLSISLPNLPSESTLPNAVHENKSINRLNANRNQIENKRQKTHVSKVSKSDKSKNICKTRRGLKRRNENSATAFKIIGTNADGLRSKKDSLINLIQTERPAVFMIQETKMKQKKQINIEGYELFEEVRSGRGGGGLLIGIDNTIDVVPVVITQEDEILAIEMELKSMKLRVATAYGPQESAPPDQINEFYSKLENLIIQCNDDGCGLMMEMDCNAKLGKEIIEGDPHEMSTNGRLLWDIVRRRGCCVVNATKNCEGTITRCKEKKGRKEQSAIDFVIVNSLVEPLVTKMTIDESKIQTLSSYSKSGVKLSDHNIISCTFAIPTSKRRLERKEMYILRDENSLRSFKEATTHTTMFTQNFTRDGDVRVEGKKWLKQLMGVIHANFKKVRVRRKPPLKKSIQP